MDEFNLAEELLKEYGQKNDGKEEKEKFDVLLSLESWESIRSKEIKIEWIIDRLIPKDSIILLFGKGGIGKTWLTLDMARCIGMGIPYLGFSTAKTPVIFVDFENPLAVLNTRTQKLGETEGVYFWRANNDQIGAPKLDNKDYVLYKQLPRGAILIFDTLRASQDRDENKSHEMALILGRLKELRDMGFTIILLHHTAKNSDKMAKGSTAIVDLADHILGLTLVKKKRDGQEIVIDDEDNEDDLVYRFGVREKTRFEPYQIYLTLNPDRGFDLAPDPQEDTLATMHKIISDLGAADKTSFISTVKTKLSLSLHKSRKLFETGEGRYWTIKKSEHNKQIVTPIELFSYSTLYSADKLTNWNSDIQSARITENKNNTQVTNSNELFSYSKPILQTGKLEKTDNFVEGVI